MNNIKTSETILCQVGSDLVQSIVEAEYGRELTQDELKVVSSYLFESEDLSDAVYQEILNAMEEITEDNGQISRETDGTEFFAQTT